METSAISTREAEVLAAVGEHLSNAQIAHRLHISVRTVESHVSALLRKLDAPDRQALAGLAEQSRTGRFAGRPVSRTTFVGRTAERAAVEAALDESRLVTVVGPGGVGKTRLVAAVAEHAADRFRAGGAFVDLVPVRAGSAGAVVRAVAETLGVTEGPAQPVERAVFERLRLGRPLLVLDNCEHVIDEVSALAEQVLGQCPQATVLATSRQRLGVAGERLVHLRPMDGVDVEQLFRDRAVGADPGFAAAPATVAAVCARLDGLPLAVELAAARVAALGADGLLAGLDDQLQILAGGRGVHTRHHSLLAVIGWSYDLLDEDERAMLRRLCAFVGVFDLDAAVALSPLLSRPEVADRLGRLVDQSLVVRVGPGRWRLLDTIRAFGLAQVDAVGEQDALRERYLRWAFASATDLEARLDSDWQPAFDELADDLRAAAIAVETDPAAHRFLRAFARLTFAAGRFVEARTLYEAAARCGTGAEQGQDLRAAADSALAVADNRAAIDLARSAADAAGTAELQALAAMYGVRYRLGSIELPAAQRESLLAAARGAVAAGPADRRLAALVAVATAWHEGRDWIADLDQARAAVELARVAGDPIVLLATMDALGGALLAAGATRAAHRVATERLQLATTLPRHDPAAVAEVIDAFHTASVAALGAGDLPAALAMARRSRTDDPMGGHPYLQAPRLVRVLALTGDWDESLSRAEALWTAWRRDGEPPMSWMASALALGAMIHGLRGDPSAQREWRERAMTVAAGTPAVAACLAFADARVSVHSGQFDEAAGQVERAFAEFADPRWVGYARVAGAELAVVADRPDAAERIQAAEPYAAESDWAAAGLARVRGRLGDGAALADAAERWGRIGARFERAATLALIPERAVEGRADLAALGCPPWVEPEPAPGYGPAS